MNIALLNFSNFALATLIAGFYFCLGRFGLSLGFVPSASAIWPCTGFGVVAVLLLRNFRSAVQSPAATDAALWSWKRSTVSPAGLGIFVGSFFVNWSVTGHVPSSICIAGGNTAEAVVCAYLMQRFANGVRAFDRVSDILRFIFLAAVPSTIISATVGASSISLFKLIQADQFSGVWLTWWVGDLVSALVLIPLLVLWITRPVKHLKARNWMELAAAMVLVFIAAEWVFGSWAAPRRAFRLAFIQLPLFVCIGLQFGQRTAISAAFVTSAVAIVGTLSGYGPFAWENQNDGLLALQAFISLLTITTLMMSAVVGERRQIEQSLRRGEERYRSLVTASAQIVWVSDPHGQICEDSPTWRRFTGQTYEKMKGSGWIDALHPEDQEKMRQEQRTALDEKTPRELKYRLRSADGNYHPMSVRAVPIVDSSGQLREWIGTCTDVTETQRAERENGILLSLGQKLNSATTTQQAGQIVIEAAQELFGWDACFIYLLNEKGGLLPVVNFDTLDRKRVSVPPEYAGSKPSPTAREVIDRGAKLILREQPGFAPAEAFPFGDKKRPSASLIYVPLRSSEQVVGLLSIQSYIPQAYSAANLAAMQSLADYCGGAMERIRTTEALRESEEEFRTLSESSPLGIFKTNGQGQCTYNNARLLAISEITLQDCLGEGWSNSVHPDDRAAVKAEWMQAQAKGEEWCSEHRVLTKSGKVRWVRALAQPIHGGDGKLAGYVGCVEDITERKRMLEALSESEEQFRTLCESSPLGIFKSDAQARCTYHNSRLLALAETTFEECLGDGWANSVHPDDRDAVTSDWADARAKGRECCNEHRILTKSGIIRWVRTLAQPIHGADGKPAGYVGCVEDITERKRADEELRNAQTQLKKYATELEERVTERTAELQETVHSLESFSYSIAHDLRAPLRAIQGLTAVLAEEYAPQLDETAVDLSRRIVESASRMDNLIEDLLSYSRLSREEIILNGINSETALKLVLSELSEEIKARNATVEICNPLPEVLANATVLEQVFANLISNALKFVAQDVTPHIRIRAERRVVENRNAADESQQQFFAPASLLGRSSVPMVRIWIEDNGIGIAPQHHQRIFGVFQRLHGASVYPGTGIGLAIVRKGIERMGGSAGLESELEKGTRFWIELPAV